MGLEECELILGILDVASELERFQFRPHSCFEATEALGQMLGGLGPLLDVLHQIQSTIQGRLLVQGEADNPLQLVAQLALQCPHLAFPRLNLGQEQS